MADIPEHELEETRAALAPTLEATAAILPWVARPKKPRFDAKLNARWIAAGRRLAAAWSERHGGGANDIRPAIFGLYAIAIETADTHCLRLGEALASAADRLEENVIPTSGRADGSAPPAGLDDRESGNNAPISASRRVNYHNCALP